jgi:TonB family protein
MRSRWLLVWLAGLAICGSAIFGVLLMESPEPSKPVVQTESLVEAESTLTGESSTDAGVPVPDMGAARVQNADGSDDLRKRLDALASRTRPRLPTAAEILAPSTPRELAMAEMDLERTLDMLWRNRFPPEEARRHADGLRMLAATGDSAIRLELSKLLMSGRVEADSPEEALNLALLEAEAGNAEAALLVGQALESGHGIVTDYALAREWYLFAADAGYPDGWAELGMMEAMGFGGPIDGSAAVDAFTRAWEAGSALGARRLGIAYLEGWGVEKDLNTGRAWLEAAGEAGDADAWFALAYAEKAGVFGPENAKRREEYLLKGARVGNVEAAASITPELALRGDEWAQRGVDVLTAAAQEGTVRALLGLTDVLATEPSREHLRDTEALLWRARDLGSDEALYRLAWFNANMAHYLLSNPHEPAELLREIRADSKFFAKASLMLEAIEAGRPQTLAFNEIDALSDDEAYVRWHSRKEAVRLPTESGQVDELVSAPRAVHMVRPFYPPALLTEKLSGSVRVTFVVDSDGSVRTGSVEILRSFHPAFDESVLAAVPQWRFEPARKNGDATESRVNIEIPFRAAD